jgi:putative redox protein
MAKDRGTPAGFAAGTEREATTGEPPTRPPNRVHVVWKGDHQFDTGRPGGPVARLDGRGQAGQTPVDAVLSALASCTSVDIIEILAKRRTPVRALEIDVTGTRVETTPRRLTHIELTFRVTGDGIERHHAERAVELAITRYCSVKDSLRSDIEIAWTVELAS